MPAQRLEDAVDAAVLGDAHLGGRLPRGGWRDGPPASASARIRSSDGGIHRAGGSRIAHRRSCSARCSAAWTLPSRPSITGRTRRCRPPRAPPPLARAAPSAGGAGVPGHRRRLAGRHGLARRRPRARGRRAGLVAGHSRRRRAGVGAAPAAADGARLIHRGRQPGAGGRALTRPGPRRRATGRDSPGPRRGRRRRRIPARRRGGRARRPAVARNCGIASLRKRSRSPRSSAMVSA